MTRIEFNYTNRGTQSKYHAAKEHQKKHGGWIVEVGQDAFGSFWCERVFWYDHNHTRSGILRDFSGHTVFINRVEV